MGPLLDIELKEKKREKIANCSTGPAADAGERAAAAATAPAVAKRAIPEAFPEAVGTRDNKVAVPPERKPGRAWLSSGSVTPIMNCRRPSRSGAGRDAALCAGIERSGSLNRGGVGQCMPKALRFMPLQRMVLRSI